MKVAAALIALAPERGVTTAAFADRAELDFGEVWQGHGFSHDLLSAALCRAADRARP